MNLAKPSVAKVIDWPLGIGLSLSIAYYAVILQPPFHGTLLHRYTTEHLVEYAVVVFFLWGVVDTFFHVAGFPREFMALRHEWSTRRFGREPASVATVWLARMRALSPGLLGSRIGQRYLRALTFVDEKGSADGLADHLRRLADDDYEKTQSNFALLRFICWVMPMFGFLGTVVHFGTALAGQTSTSIADNLPHVVAAMGTAFNTTTAALAGATTMMFAVFLCERVERSMIYAIDERIERDLLNRFQVADANLAPFLDALASSNRATLDALDAAVVRQAELGAQALATALERLEERFDDHDRQRHEQFHRLIQAFEEQSHAQVAALRPAAERIAGLHTELERFVDSLAAVAGQHGELVTLQTSLAANLRLICETRQIDQAMHGLTAAIHLLTARGGSFSEARAA